MQFVDLLCHRNDGFLHDFLRFGIGQTGFLCRRVNQFPIGIEKVLPAPLIVPVRKSIHQAATSG